MHACVLLIFQAFQDFFFLFSSSSLDSIAQRKIFKSQIFIHHGFILSQFSPASICKVSKIPTLLFILFPAASVFMNVGQMKIQWQRNERNWQVGKYMATCKGAHKRKLSYYEKFMNIVWNGVDTYMEEELMPVNNALKDCMFKETQKGDH